MKQMQQGLKQTIRSAAVEVPKPSVPIVEPTISLNGYIDHKVDFVASLSEAASNSWDEEASISANDPNNVSGDEYDDEDGRPKVRFDKDDGPGLMFSQAIMPVKVNKSIELPTSQASKLTEEQIQEEKEI